MYRSEMPDPGRVGIWPGGLRGEEPGGVCSAAALPHGADKTPWRMKPPLDHHSFPQVHVVPTTFRSAAVVSPPPIRGERLAVPTLRPGRY